MEKEKWNGFNKTHILKFNKTSRFYVKKELSKILHFKRGVKQIIKKILTMH